MTIEEAGNLDIDLEGYFRLFFITIKIVMFRNIINPMVIIISDDLSILN